jgi:hypothetical protein
MNGRWPQFRDRPQDVGEEVSRNRDLGHLERDRARVADDLRADTWAVAHEIGA